MNGLALSESKFHTLLHAIFTDPHTHSTTTSMSTSRSIGQPADLMKRLMRGMLLTYDKKYAVHQSTILQYQTPRNANMDRDTDMHMDMHRDIHADTDRPIRIPMNADDYSIDSYVPESSSMGVVHVYLHNTASHAPIYWITLCGDVDNIHRFHVICKLHGIEDAKRYMSHHMSTWEDLQLFTRFGVRFLIICQNIGDMIWIKPAVLHTLYLPSHAVFMKKPVMDYTSLQLIIQHQESICMPIRMPIHTLDGGIPHVSQCDLLSLPDDGTLKHDITSNIYSVAMHLWYSNLVIHHEFHLVDPSSLKYIFFQVRRIQCTVRSVLRDRDAHTHSHGDSDAAQDNSGGVVDADMIELWRYEDSQQILSEAEEILAAIGGRCHRPSAATTTSAST
jgi:hypothetical protein